MFAKVMGSQSEPFQLAVCDVNVTCDQSRDLRADHVISLIFSINKHNRARLTTRAKSLHTDLFGVNLLF